MKKLLVSIMIIGAILFTFNTSSLSAEEKVDSTRATIVCSARVVTYQIG